MYSECLLCVFEVSSVCMLPDAFWNVEVSLFLAAVAAVLAVALSGAASYWECIVVV